MCNVKGGFKSGFHLPQKPKVSGKRNPEWDSFYLNRRKNHKKFQGCNQKLNFVIEHETKG